MEVVIVFDKVLSTYPNNSLSVGISVLEVTEGRNAPYLDIVVMPDFIHALIHIRFRIVPLLRCLRRDETAAPVVLKIRSGSSDITGVLKVSSAKAAN